MQEDDDLLMLLLVTFDSFWEASPLRWMLLLAVMKQ